jgi:hypothetical protein
LSIIVCILIYTTKQGVAKIPQITIQSIHEIFESSSAINSNQLMKYFECTYQCLWTYLKKIGYYTSFTHNAQYYTLADIPQFDTNGIWFYNDPVAGDIGFTKHKTANNLILHLINSSKTGVAEDDIRDVIKIRVFNQLKVLTEQLKIQRIQIGRKYYYFSQEPKIYKEQHRLLNQSFVAETTEKSSSIGTQPFVNKEHYEHTINRLMAGREKWRNRSNEKQKKLREQQIRIRDLERSRDKWKHKAINYKSQSIMLTDELKSVKKTHEYKLYQRCQAAFERKSLWF